MTKPRPLPRPLIGHPWAITEQGLELVLAVASRDEFFADVRKEALAARDSAPLDNTHDAHIRDGVAIVFVKGPLFRYASMFGDVSAATSYGELRKDFQRLLEDDGVNAILFNVDSPGGEVNGCNELAEAIYTARGRKPMAAYVGGTCASAAYWIASAAGEIYCDSTAELGSIGCKMCLVDDTGEQKEDGRRRIEIVSSQSPGKASDPADNAYRARLQAQCDDLAAVFIGAVARNRGVSAVFAQQSYGQGDVLVGARAVDAGLANGISNFEAVLADMTRRGVAAQQAKSTFNPNKMGASKMDLKVMAKLLKLDESSSEQQIEDRAQALARFEREALAATDATSAEIALGRMRAGAEAIAERDFLKVELKAQQGAETKRVFRGVLKEALKDNRLTLAQLTKVIPTFLKDDEKAKALAAIAAAPEQSKKLLLDAICTADISAKRLASVRAYLEAQSPQLPTAHAEPPLDEQNRQAVTAGAGEFERQFGLSEGALAKFSNISSVADIERAARKAKA